MDGHWDGNYGNPALLQETTTLTRRGPQHKAGRLVPQVPTSFNTKNGLMTWIYLDGLGVNVNPGLINHGLLIRGYSSNSHNLILTWYPPN